MNVWCHEPAHMWTLDCISKQSHLMTADVSEVMHLQQGSIKLQQPPLRLSHGGRFPQTGKCIFHSSQVPFHIYYSRMNRCIHRLQVSSSILSILSQTGPKPSNTFKNGFHVRLVIFKALMGLATSCVANMLTLFEAAWSRGSSRGGSSGCTWKACMFLLIQYNHIIMITQTFAEKIPGRNVNV